MENTARRQTFIQALIARKSELSELLSRADTFLKMTLLKEDGDDSAQETYLTSCASETDSLPDTPGLTEHQEIDDDVEYLPGTPGFEDIASATNGFSPGPKGGIDEQAPLIEHPLTYSQANVQNADAFVSDPNLAAFADEPSYFDDQMLGPPATPRSDCSVLGDAFDLFARKLPHS